MRKENLFVSIPAIFLLLAFIIPALILGSRAPSFAESQSVPRVNVPSWSTGESYAIFWFGDVGPNNNYADVRLIQDGTTLEITIHVIDRLLYYDTSPSSADLNQWDAATLYLDLDGNSSSILDESAYRFDAQLNWWESRNDWQAGYRWNGTAWVADPLSFSTISGYRGEGLNDNSDDKGWLVSFYIPFSSLSLSNPPSSGTEWDLAIALHDRDSSNGPALPDKVWPELMDPETPSTWGKMHFGIPGYEKPDAVPKGVVTIRQGLNGSSVMDGHVGGHTTCGEGLDHWSEWGNTNYAGYEQINVMNQWDISDYPCFSKYFVTFPLDSIPPGKVILAASLKMHLFGNAGQGWVAQPPDSYVQVLTVGEDWDEATLTWNNAPLATENFYGTWVEPVDSLPDWPGIPYQWDVSRAAAKAYMAGKSLRLALYSADGERHTGKYFYSSDADVAARPTLEVVWGNLCDSPDITCSYTYIPLATK